MDTNSNTTHSPPTDEGQDALTGIARALGWLALGVAGIAAIGHLAPYVHLRYSELEAWPPVFVCLGAAAAYPFVKRRSDPKALRRYKQSAAAVVALLALSTFLPNRSDCDSAYEKSEALRAQQLRMLDNWYACVGNGSVDADECIFDEGKLGEIEAIQTKRAALDSKSSWACWRPFR